MTEKAKLADRIDMFGVPHWDEFEDPCPEHCYYQVGRRSVKVLYVRQASPGFLEYGIQFDGDTEDEVFWYTFSGSYEVTWA